MQAVGRTWAETICLRTGDLLDLDEKGRKPAAKTTPSPTLTNPNGAIFVVYI